MLAKKKKMMMMMLTTMPWMRVATMAMIMLMSGMEMIKLLASPVAGLAQMLHLLYF